MGCQKISSHTNWWNEHTTKLGKLFWFDYVLYKRFSYFLCFSFIHGRPSTQPMLHLTHSQHTPAECSHCCGTIQLWSAEGRLQLFTTNIPFWVILLFYLFFIYFFNFKTWTFAHFFHFLIFFCKLICFYYIFFKSMVLTIAL